MPIPSDQLVISSNGPPLARQRFWQARSQLSACERQRFSTGAPTQVSKRPPQCAAQVRQHASETGPWSTSSGNSPRSTRVWALGPTAAAASRDPAPRRKPVSSTRSMGPRAGSQIGPSWREPRHAEPCDVRSPVPLGMCLAPSRGLISARALPARKGSHEVHTRNSRVRFSRDRWVERPPIASQ